MEVLAVAFALVVFGGAAYKIFFDKTKVDRSGPEWKRPDVDREITDRE